MGSELSGVIYILDEPSIGLHQRDNEKLLATLKRMRDIGNTVVVVEHDEETIQSADHVIDFGPGAGVRGGAVIHSGTPKSLANNRKSITGAYLSGRESVRIDRERRKANGEIKLRGANENNLKQLDVSFPSKELWWLLPEFQGQENQHWSMISSTPRFQESFTIQQKK